MNICFVNNYDISPNSGGVNRISFLLSDYFKNEYHYNCYLAYIEENNIKPTANLDGKIKLSQKIDKNALDSFFKSNQIDVIVVNFLRKYNLPILPQVYEIAKNNHIPLIFCFHVFPGYEIRSYSTLEKVIYALFHNGNVISELRWTFRSSFVFLTNLLSKIVLKTKYFLPYDNCDKIVVLSESYIDLYAKLACVTDKNKFVAIGNACTFKESFLFDNLHIKQKEVLVVARMEEHTKRLSLVLKIWKKIELNKNLDDWSLTIVGDGNDYNYYLFLAKKLKLQRCNFTGHQMPLPYYKRASIFMMTSSAEGWPMTITEALQMGVVPIAFNSFGALHEIIKNDYNGIIVPNNDIDLYVQNLTKLILDDEKRLYMAKNAIEYSHNFRIGKIAEKWDLLFKNVIENNK